MFLWLQPNHSLHLDSGKPTQFPIFYEVAANNLRPAHPVFWFTAYPASVFTFGLIQNHFRQISQVIPACIIFLKHYISVRLQNRTQLLVSQLSPERFWLFLGIIWKDIVLLPLPLWKETLSTHSLSFVSQADDQHYSFWSVILFFSAPLKLSGTINKWSNRKQHRRKSPLGL